MKKNLIWQGVLIAIGFALLLYFLAVYVPQVFNGAITPNPVLIKIGSLSIRWYGVLIASGILVAYFLTIRQFKAEKIDTTIADNIILIVVLSGLIGARIGFVIQTPSFYLNHILEIFAVWDGGLSIHGAIITGLISLAICARTYKINFLKFANIISPQIMLAGAIGRWGNFFNQEIVGKPTTSIPWKMFVSPSNRLHGFENFSFFHPVFLYESILLASAYLVYLLIRKYVGNKYGLVYTLIVYSLIRIIVEFWRIDYKPILSFLDLSQIVSFGIILFGLGVLFSTKFKLKLER